VVASYGWTNTVDCGGAGWRFSVLSSRFSVLSSQYSVLNTRFSILGTRFLGLVGRDLGVGSEMGRVFRGAAGLRPRGTGEGARHHMIALAT